jgi:hypothetical protein
MKILTVFMISTILGIGLAQGLWAQTPTDEPTPSAPVSTQIEQEKLEIEKLKLENEKMQLEMEKMTLQATQTAVPVQTSPTPKGDVKEDVKVYQSEASQKAEELAKANKDKENLLVLDLVNGEVWNKGIRYNIHELYTLAEDRGWKMTKSLNERDVAGHARTLYKFRNTSLLKYENRDMGIFKVTAPSGTDDFDFLTPDGISFSSSTGDVRNAFQSMYFTYDREEHQGRFNVLRYNHSRGLAFSDKLEVGFDRDGKMAELRYGVLDEK